MPVFTQALRSIDFANPTEALKKMANHIAYIQEQLEYTLANLDSQNITALNTNITQITDGTGTASFGTRISLSGDKGEEFVAGKGVNGVFEFSVKGKGGTQVMYMDSTGNMIITKHSNIAIDGGEW